MSDHLFSAILGSEESDAQVEGVVSGRRRVNASHAQTHRTQHFGKVEKFNRRDNMLNFNLKTRSATLSPPEIPTAEMIVELQARGIDMTSAIEQLQAERKQKKVAVAGSKVVEFPRRE